MLFGAGLAIFAQNYVLPDDVYYRRENFSQKDVQENSSENEENEILISEPRVEDYQEGTIIYRREDGSLDTLHIFGDPEIYLEKLGK